VQYRESELNFISRLMEEAGISFFFEQEENNHVLVMCDGEAASGEGSSYSNSFLCIPADVPYRPSISKYRLAQSVVAKPA
jgi:type VI secretion system secreted protein VgrG